MPYSQRNNHIVVLHSHCGGKKRKMGEMQFGPKSRLIHLNVSISPGQTHQVALPAPPISGPCCPLSLLSADKHSPLAAGWLSVVILAQQLFLPAVKSHPSGSALAPSSISSPLPPSFCPYVSNVPPGLLFVQVQQLSLHMPAALNVYMCVYCLDVCELVALSCR